MTADEKVKLLIGELTLFLLLFAFPLFAAEVNSLQESELQLQSVSQRKQVLAQEYERGKILLDHGSILMRDSQRAFNELTVEENRLRELVLKLRNEKKE